MTTKTKRLGKKEKEIINYMENGWELCKGRGYAFLQDKGVGSGGRVIDVPFERAFKLYAKDIVCIKEKMTGASTLILCKNYKEKM